MGGTLCTNKLPDERSERRDECDLKEDFSTELNGAIPEKVGC